MRPSTTFRLLPILALLLAACQPAPGAAGGGVTAPSPLPAASAVAPTSPPQDTAPTPAPRTATLEIAQGEVNWRASEADDWQPAQVGQLLAAGHQLSTGADSRAAVRFSEGTLTRISPNSAFTLTGMTEYAADPASSFKLDAGGLFIILNGGSAEVETESGVASVRGSYLNVRLTPRGSTIAACLEGNCTLSAGGQEVPLTNGQRSQADAEDLPPADAEPMEAYDFNLWFEEDDDAFALALELELVDEEDFAEGCDFDTGKGCELEDPCDYETGDGCELDEDFCDDYDAAFCEDGEFEDDFEFADDDGSDDDDDDGDDHGGDGNDDGSDDDDGGDDHGGDDDDDD